MPNPPALPEILSLQVCERVIRDVDSRQSSVIGILDTIASHGFPLTIPHLTLFMELTSGHGRTELKVRLVDSLEEHPPLFEAVIDANLGDPLVVHQVPITTLGLKFPAPGQYRVQVYAMGTLLRERKFRLVQVVPPQAPPPSGTITGPEGGAPPVPPRFD